MHCETNKNTEIMKKVILTILLAVITVSANAQSKYNNVTNGQLILGLTTELISKEDMTKICNARIQQLKLNVASAEITMRDTKDPLKYAKAKDVVENEKKGIEYLSKLTTTDGYNEYKRRWEFHNKKAKK